MEDKNPFDLDIEVSVQVIHRQEIIIKQVNRFPVLIDILRRDDLAEEIEQIIALEILHEIIRVIDSIHVAFKKLHGERPLLGHDLFRFL